MLHAINFDADGIALSADGEALFFVTTDGRELRLCPTVILRDPSSGFEIHARAGIQYRGEAGFKGGMDTDANNIFYAGNLEDNNSHGSSSDVDWRTGVVLRGGSCLTRYSESYCPMMRNAGQEVPPARN